MGSGSPDYEAVDHTHTHTHTHTHSIHTNTHNPAQCSAGGALPVEVACVFLDFGIVC